MEMANGIPEWNFQILVNVFEDDNYWDTSLKEDLPEVYEAITSIGRKYGDIAEYEEAMAKYNEYMPQVIDYYGGEKVVEYIMENYDIIPVGIIKPPKLKGKLKEKYIEGISYTTGKFYEPVSAEEQKEWDEERFANNSNPVAKDLPPLTRELKRAIKGFTRKPTLGAKSVYFNTDIISQIKNGDIDYDGMTNEEKIVALPVSELLKMYDKQHEDKPRELTNAEKLELINDGEESKMPINKYSVQQQIVTTDMIIRKAMIKAGLNPITDKERAQLSTADIKRLAQFLGPEYVYDDKMMRKMMKKSEKMKKKSEKERERYNRSYSEHNANVNRALASLLSKRSKVARWEEDDD